MTDRLWVLGAPDPEMQAIEALLIECGERVVYALDERGERVHAGNAYRAVMPAPVQAGRTYEVECMIADRSALVAESAITFDHHRPGDPGYGRPPSDFLAASSLGHVIAELARLERLPRTWREQSGAAGGVPAIVGSIGQRAGDWIVTRGLASYMGVAAWYGQVIPRDLVLTAAADHCLGAAYAGQCPGVDPDELMRWRAESRARFQGRDVEDVLADVERARQALLAAPHVSLGYAPDAPACDYHTGHPDAGCPDCDYLGGIQVRDLRGRHVPELPDAAARYGHAYIARVTTDGSGRPCRPKVVLGGRTTPEMVRAFIEHWAPAQGLTDIYGDPERGFAGGYE